MGTVSSYPYLITGNGGRNYVKLTNGWQVAMVLNLNNPGGAQAERRDLRIYISKNNGTTWTHLTSLGWTSTDSNLLINPYMVARGNIFYILYSNQSATYLRGYDAETSAWLPSSITLDSGQTSGSIIASSLTISRDGTEIHGCNTSVNSDYPLSNNIRYFRCKFGSDGELTRDILEQVTTINISGKEFIQPSITLRHDNVPVIACQTKGVRYSKTDGSVILEDTSSSISALIRDTSTFYTPDIHPQEYTHSNWVNQTINWADRPGLANPSLVTTVHDDLEVAFEGLVAGKDIITIVGNRSINGGFNWASQNGYDYGYIDNATLPSVTTDRSGSLWIVYERHKTETDYDIYYTYVEYGTRAVKLYTSVTSTTNQQRPNALYDPTCRETYSYNSSPPYIYMNGAAVTSTGTSNNMVFLSVKTADGQPIINGEEFSYKDGVNEDFALNLNAYVGEVNAAASLQYRVSLNNVVYINWTDVANDTWTQVTIPKDLLTGKKIILVEAQRQSYPSTADKINFTIKNLQPISYSQRDVYNLIMDYV